MDTFQTWNTYPNPNPVSIKPKIPYFGTLPPLSAGSLYIIYGRVPSGAKNFAINLMVGSVITEELQNSGDIALHFNPRFNDQQVVRNSRQNQKWGPEEREPKAMPFNVGHDFETMILVEEKFYKVAVNGQHFIDYEHRIPFSCVGVLNIAGDVEVYRIEYRREMRYFPQPNAIPIVDPLSTTLQPIFNPPVPYVQSFSIGLREGFMIYISGRLNQSPKQFTIDFLCGPLPKADIAFHFNARIKDSLVVRNSCLSGKWGEEERKISDFPFSGGVNFDLIIRIESNRYMVAVNGQHFIEFKHRIPLHFVNGISIGGDLNITSIRYAHT